MQICNRVVVCCVAGLAPLLSAGGVLALDERKTMSAITVTPLPQAAPRVATPPAYANPQQALGKYIEGYRSGEPVSNLDALLYAAEGGEKLARWKLGSMYAAGDGVPHDDKKAYEYFSQIVDAYDGNAQGRAERAVVASAFVAVGAYSLTGVPEARVARDPAHAVEMFTIAATEFGDPHAQYNLGRMMLEGEGVRKDERRGARWLKLAADKQHPEAQALLGNLYFFGAEGIARQRAVGLMYLTLARDGIADRKKDKWIVDLYDGAVSASNDLDRQAALVYRENFVRDRR